MLSPFPDPTTITTPHRPHRHRHFPVPSPPLHSKEPASMDFYLELLLTSLISVLIFLLIGKLVDAPTDSPPAASSATHEPRPAEPAESQAPEVTAPEPEEPGEGAPVEAEASAPAAPAVEGEEDEWEWEGVERSEVERVFAAAVGYVSGVGSEAVRAMSADARMKMEALYRVATEGPCYEAQPSLLNFSARAKWHAWQSLGNMNPDVAMEQYISILSQNIPEWMGEKSGEDAKQDDGDDTSAPAGIGGTWRPDSGSSLDCQPSSEISSKTGEPADAVKSSVGSELCRQGLAMTLFLNLLSPTPVRFLCFYC